MFQACLLTENAKKESEVMRRSIAQLRAEVTELHEKNASFSSQLADKQQIIEESQAKLEKLQTEIKTCQSQFEKDRKASCERGTKVKDLRDQLQKKAQEIEDFENKFKQLNSENEVKMKFHYYATLKAFVCFNFFGLALKRVKK